MKRWLYYFSLLITFAVVFSYWNLVSADLKDGLILHVTFEGKEPVDDSPDPTEISVFAGDLGQDEGKVGKAGVFNNTVLEVTDAPKLSGMKALTIAAWINTEKATETSIVSKRNAQGNGDTYNFFLWTGNKLSGRINNNGDFFSTTVFSTGEWYHVAFVFDGNDGSEKIYVNGELDAETVKAEREVPETTSSVWIGELDSARGFQYTGLMDEVTMWNRALDEDEIKLVMSGLKMPVESQGKLATTWGEIK
jgi:hypothetical protein